jgi:GWxTD domain-containing protein
MKTGRSLNTLFLAALAAGVVLEFSVTAAPARQDAGSTQAQAPAAQPDNNKSKTKSKSNNALYKELDSPYRKWLDEDVVYIITSEERNAFLHLQTNEEREQFIEAFWQRRNPDPDSPDNAFKDEHYRRIAYTNEHFASGVPGWKTDRGRIYIAWGAPDDKEEHVAGDQWQRPMDQGGGETSTYAYEDWTYHYLEGYGGASKENVEFEFVDPSGTGEFHLTSDPSEKDALLYVPNAGLTQNEALGLASKTSRFQNGDGTHMAENGFQRESLNEFTRLQNFAAAFAPPPVKFKDLQEDASSRVVRDQLKFDYRLDFLRITSDTVLVPITVQMPRRQMTFVEKSSVDTATVNLFGRVSSLSGRVIQTFEDTMSAEVPASIIQQSLTSSEIYQKAVPLSPGLYRLDLVLKDVNSGNVGVVNARLAVPRFQDDQLSASSLILADQITRVSSKDIGLGQFVLGDMKVRPKMDQAFLADGAMGIFLQVYNLKVDDKNHKPDASVQYRVMKDKDSAPVLTFDVPQNKLPIHGEEMTLQDALTLGSLAPGKYKLQIAITDNLAKQTITPTADFTVQSAPAPAAK